MTFNTDFYGNVKEIVLSEREALNELQAQLDEVEKDIFSNNKKFTSQYIREELHPKRNQLKRQMEDRKALAHDRIQRMCDDYIQELRDEDELDPSKLTDDVRLLNSGVKMTARDIKAMLKRNSDNRTMLQVILRYADEHNIETDGTYYSGNNRTIMNVASVPVVADSCIKWHGSESVWNQLMGDQSEMGQFFSKD